MTLRSTDALTSASARSATTKWSSTILRRSREDSWQEQESPRRQLDEKRRALTRLAFAPYLAIHRLDQALDDGEAQARRVLARRRTRAQPREFAKQASAVRGRNPRAFILHFG